MPCGRSPLADPGTSWSGMQETFSGWLRDLPKPVGVLCSMDGVARRLAATCRSMDLNVPEEVAILGVNDDEFECVVARPNLSSIAIPAAPHWLRRRRLAGEFDGRRTTTAKRHHASAPRRGFSALHRSGSHRRRDCSHRGSGTSGALSRTDSR